MTQKWINDFLIGIFTHTYTMVVVAASEIRSVAHRLTLNNDNNEYMKIDNISTQYICSHDTKVDK